MTITATITSAQSHTNPIAPVLSTVLANAVEGLKVEFNLSAEEKAEPAFISIVGDMKIFEGAGKITDMQVSYGRLHLTDTAQGFSATMTCPPRTYLSGGTVSCSQSVPWSAQGNMKAGRLVVENGNFSASGKASDTNLSS